MTDNQLLRSEAADRAEAVAVALDRLAARIRDLAAQFSDESRPAATTVADVINTYTLGVGGNGVVFWAMVRELSRMQ